MSGKTEGERRLVARLVTIYLNDHLGGIDGNMGRAPFSSRIKAKASL